MYKLSINNAVCIFLKRITLAVEKMDWKEMKEKAERLNFFITIKLDTEHWELGETPMEIL